MTLGGEGVGGLTLFEGLWFGVWGAARGRVGVYSFTFYNTSILDPRCVPSSVLPYFVIFLLLVSFSAAKGSLFHLASTALYVVKILSVASPFSAIDRLCHICSQANLCASNSRGLYLIGNK